MEEQVKETNEAIDANIEKIDKSSALYESADKEVSDLMKQRDLLMSSKHQIDDSLLKVDVNTVESEISSIIEKGKIKRAEKENNEAQYKLYENIDNFDEDEYKSLVKEERNLSFEANDLEKSIIRKKNEVNALKKGEFCPTCGAKLKGVDNTKAISEAEEWIEESGEKLTKIDSKIKKLQKEIDKKVIETIKAQHEKARRILADNRQKLDELASYLYEKETITGSEFMTILGRKDASAI